jgi:hypothetical protein
MIFIDKILNEMFIYADIYIGICIIINMYRLKIYQIFFRKQQLRRRYCFLSYL